MIVQLNFHISLCQKLDITRILVWIWKASYAYVMNIKTLYNATNYRKPWKQLEWEKVQTNTRSIWRMNESHRTCVDTGETTWFVMTCLTIQAVMPALHTFIYICIEMLCSNVTLFNVFLNFFFISFYYFLLFVQDTVSRTYAVGVRCFPESTWTWTPVAAHSIVTIVAAQVSWLTFIYIYKLK